MNDDKPNSSLPLRWLQVTIGVTLISVLAEFAYEKHPHVSYEHWFSFYSLVAIGSTIALVLVGLLLRPLLWRDEEYYDG